MKDRLVAGKMLRRGYTTGSCAAAAAKAAGLSLLTGADPETVTLQTPGGIQLTLDVLNLVKGDNYASCAIQKDSGDDPDITNGALIYARVSLTAAGLLITGGPGVGRVTKAGLEQPVGAAAINSVPRQMIREELTALAEKTGYQAGFSVEISIPGGQALAARTFNPRLGLEGGLSILGTSGIDEPMSELALVDTIRAEISVLYAAGARDLLLTVGNYAEAFARDKLQLSLESQVKCSNFIGDSLAAAAEQGFEHCLLIGHIGKLCKLGIGLTNTHSRHGDGRIETLVSSALAAGADLNLLRAVSQAVSTDAALDLIEEAGLLAATMLVLRDRVKDTLDRHIADTMSIQVICFRGLGEKMKEVFRI